MIVAITVGSQQATTRFPGFEAKAAGFSTCTLLGRKSKFSFLAENNYIKYNCECTPSITIFKNIRYGWYGRYDLSSIFLNKPSDRIRISRQLQVIQLIYAISQFPLLHIIFQFFPIYKCQMNGRVCRLKQVFNALRKSSHGHSTINLMTKHVLSFFF